jgi:hypothetical protein
VQASRSGEISNECDQFNLMLKMTTGGNYKWKIAIFKNKSDIFSINGRIIAFNDN